MGLAEVGLESVEVAEETLVDFEKEEDDEDEDADTAEASFPLAGLSFWSSDCGISSSTCAESSPNCASCFSGSTLSAPGCGGVSAWDAGVQGV